MSKPSPKEAKPPSFYDECCAIDIIDPILQLFHAGAVRVDKVTRKLKMERETFLGRQWTFAKLTENRKCGKWFDIYFEYYKILPPPCKQCWKIVYIPASVVELIEIQKFQEELQLPAKCGIEGRDYTSGLGSYRAFWYCPFYGGLKGARAHFARIKNALIKHFGEDFILQKEESEKFFLKRGCTEMERDFGLSDSWDKIDHSAKFRLLESVWEDPERQLEEFSPLKYTNFKRWIEFAIAYGDKSVLQYLNAKSLGVTAIKYNRSDHKDDEFMAKENPPESGKTTENSPDILNILDEEGGTLSEEDDDESRG